MSAAGSIILFLMLVIIGLVASGVGMVVGYQRWKQRQKREKMRGALEQAQVYSLLLDARPTAPRRPSPRQAGGNVIVIPGAPDAAPYAGSGNVNSLAGLGPPVGWREANNE